MLEGNTSDDFSLGASVQDQIEYVESSKYFNQVYSLYLIQV